MRRAKMAAAGGLGSARGLWALLLVLALARIAVALTEQYPTLSLLKQELHQQRQGLAGGCASAGEWAEQYSAECGESAKRPSAPGLCAALRARVGAERGCRPAGCCAGAARAAGPAGSGLHVYRVESPRTEMLDQGSESFSAELSPSSLHTSVQTRKRLSPRAKMKSVSGVS